MNVVITKSVCSGSVTVPPSKSLFHRALICSALACQNDLISDKYSEIKMINQDKEMILSDDIFDTLSMINNVFCKVSFEDNKLIINALKNKLNDKKYEFKIKESASTLRLILPILFAFNLDFKIECEKSLIKRPLSIYDELFTKMGINFSHDEVVLGKGQLQSGEYEIDGSISSQFISGLLMALPILKENSKLIVNDLESVDYVLMTIDVMKKFGVEIDYSIINDENNKNKYVFDILGNQQYKHALYQVENDYTQASNFVILGLINNTNQEITIKSMNPNSIQGDRRIINELEKTGFVRFNEDNLLIKNDTKLEEKVFDLKDNPDLAPILAVYLTQTGGTLLNVNRLLFKESNRLMAITSELGKLKINCKFEKNKLIIEKKEKINSNVVFSSHNDHRIVMALAILATINEGKSIICDAECVTKSYPDFFNDLKSLNANLYSF